MTQALASFCGGLRLRSLPRHVVDRTKDLLLDHVGVSLFGAHLPWSAAVREVVLSEGGRATSTVYGFRRSSARNAALANGAAAHAIEFDDTHDEAMQHPGCSVIPAIMAIGEALDRSGGELIAAMVAGYDAQCRIGRAVGNELMTRGFHATATCGVYGAVAGVANLLRVKPDVLVSAFGLGASMSSGVMQFSQDPEGNMIKRLHSGLPAERGVLAARLAADGFAGPARAIEGSYGFAKVFAGVRDLAKVTQGIGEQYEIERITIKLYPCCKQFHSLIEAIAECRAQRRFAPRDIVAIEPFGTRAMIDAHMEYRPKSTMAAQYSLPYTTAATIVMDPSDSASFEEPAISRKDVLRIADLVKPRMDEGLEAYFPRKYPAGVRIRLRDGQELTSTVLDSRSSPERPITREDVHRKFVTVTSSLLPPRRQRQIIDTIVALDRGKTVRDLTGLLRGR